MRTYVKPDLFYENFELSHSVASGCQYKSNHAERVCGLDSSEFALLNPGEIVFSSGECTVGMELFCEQTGTDDFCIFTS